MNGKGFLTLAHNHAGSTFNIVRLAMMTEVCIRRAHEKKSWKLRKFNHRAALFAESLKFQ